MTASIELEVSPELIEGEYANYMQVSFTQWEFIITFARVIPERIKGDKVIARAVSRIIVPHLVMPKIIDALASNMSRLQTRLKEIEKEQS